MRHLPLKLIFTFPEAMQDAQDCCQQDARHPAFETDEGYYDVAAKLYQREVATIRFISVATSAFFTFEKSRFDRYLCESAGPPHLASVAERGKRGRAALMGFA
jgi:hypothetical protein